MFLEGAAREDRALMIFESIREDLRHFCSNASEERSEVLRVLWNNPGLKALIVYRLGRWLRCALRSPLWWPVVVILTPVYLLLTAYYRFAYDIHLEQSADIGRGLYIGHFGGIRVRSCHIGAYCAIQQEVFIGPASPGLVGPRIGDRVWIGAHSIIKGSITVGDRATIAAGSRIISDVGIGCLMLGNPSRVGQNGYDNSGFL